uniref:Layilin b n=1 Tax=Cyprinus carpio TaxID=7962 RepID=A0A8C1PIY7_CYPCA
LSRVRAKTCLRLFRLTSCGGNRTEKPCYKITSFQDIGLRASFEAARQKCREDDGELLSIETENEQRLVERFVQEFRASDGDFWIGLRRSPQYNADCSSQYYWLDYSQATFRNWLVTEPSCGLDQCVALFYRPSSSAGQKEHNLFKWTDYNCNSKNNFICKYSDGRRLLMLTLAVTFRYLIGNKSETSIFSVNVLYKRTSNVNCAASCMCLEKHPVPTPAGNITTLTGKQILKLYLVRLLLFF